MKLYLFIRTHILSMTQLHYCLGKKKKNSHDLRFHSISFSIRWLLDEADFFIMIGQHKVATDDLDQNKTSINVFEHINFQL